MSQPQTYFHVGYARAASTFLQKTVFPALTGIQYIPRNRFRVRESEKKRFRADKILMSREAGEYIFERCDDVKRIFDSKIIISLRRHDSLASSHYRLLAKNGHTIRFNQYLDLDNNQGARKIDEYEYMRVIEYAEKITGEKPLVLIFEDYLSDPEFYIASLCAFLECGVDKQALDHKPVHKSYSDKQLRLRRQLSDRFVSPDDDLKKLASETIEHHTRWYKLKHKFVLWFTGIYMRLIKFAPDSWLSDEPLLDQQHLQNIQEFYADDWRACQEYVAAQSVRLGVKRSANTPVKRCSID